MIKLFYIIIGFILGLLTGIFIFLSEFTALTISGIKRLWKVLNE